MIKLYRKTGDRHQYWEAWENEGTVTVHWGRVGERGEDRAIPVANTELGNAIIEREAAPLRAAGFHAIPFDNHDVIVVQYHIDGMGTPGDLKKRHEVEAFLNGQIGWLGAGMVDGGDIGSGTMNIFMLVVDGPIMAPKVVELLRSSKLLGEAVVATAGTDLEYKVVHPRDYQGKFSI